MDPGIVALIGTVVGGPAVMKIMDFLMTRKQRKDTHAKEIREELRKDLEISRKETAEAKEETRRVEKELDSWKDKYFEELEITWKGREVVKE